MTWVKMVAVNAEFSFSPEQVKNPLTRSEN